MAHLVIKNGTRKGARFPINESGISIGRSRECTVTIKEPSLSRQHAEIKSQESDFFIKDIGSKNGIEIDEQSVREFSLQMGSEFKLGKIRFKIEEDDEQINALAVAEENAPMEQVDETDLTAQDEERNWDEDVQTEMSAGTKAKSAKSLVMVASLLFCLMLAVWVLVQSMEPPQLKPTLLMLKAGEKRLYNLLTHMRVVGNMQVESSEPLVMRVRFDAENRQWILYAEALETGESIVTISQGEAQLKKFKFIVKGRVKRKSIEASDRSLNENELVEKATDHITKGRALIDEEPFRAMEFMGRGIGMLANLSARPDIYFTARADVKRAERTLDKRLKDIYAEYRRARKNQEHINALGTLRKIVLLVPDPTHIDHQRALIYRDRLKGLIAKEMQKK